MDKTQESTLHDAVRIGGKIRNLINDEGFQAYTAKIKGKFDESYSRLRKALKDPSYYRLQGRLDALEEVLSVPDELLHESELAEQELQEIKS